MSKDRLKHSLDELFSDFAPPTPEGKVEPSNLPPRSDIPAVADIPQADAPKQQDPYETRPLLEKENVNEEKDIDKDEKIGQKDDSSPEDNTRTWRAGWRGLASENTNGKGRTDSVRGSIGIRRRRLADGGRKSGEGEL